jgi:hypothetical protein
MFDDPRHYIAPPNPDGDRHHETHFNNDAHIGDDGAYDVLDAAGESPIGHFGGVNDPHFHKYDNAGDYFDDKLGENMRDHDLPPRHGGGETWDDDDVTIGPGGVPKPKEHLPGKNERPPSGHRAELFDGLF